jgi:hypothetical protein
MGNNISENKKILIAGSAVGLTSLFAYMIYKSL